MYCKIKQQKESLNFVHDCVLLAIHITFIFLHMIEYVNAVIIVLLYNIQYIDYLVNE